MKNIRELSEVLGISKTAIYNKMKGSLKDELKGHIFKLENVTHVDDIGEEIIIESLNRERQEVLREMLEASDETNIQPSFQLIETQSPQALLELLQKQIQIKDEQIETLNNHICQLINQLNNSHLLLKAEQCKTVLYTAHHEPDQRQRKSFWERFRWKVSL